MRIRGGSPEFALKCTQKLSSLKAGEAIYQVSVLGKLPYTKPASVPLCPTASSVCDGCLACVAVCPAHAIPKDSPRKTNKALCICCTACVAACPRHARAFHSPLYAIAAKAFAAKNSSRKESQTFI